MAIRILNRINPLIYGPETAIRDLDSGFGFLFFKSLSSFARLFYLLNDTTVGTFSFFLYKTYLEFKNWANINQKKSIRYIVSLLLMFFL